ncbi:hypothetical protein BCR34DRAFT_556340 [Clohesyomyces aquaticus]|uniref:Uncharacterized protein n=1 Tax=Clohesyomyces aquaticus TaxID=1231657 RepID=A0A1Y2A3F6_9PLEO|nr:hypothetical protein BCR34DRAFT_556340 [Clohesyomyces aquaticus]
MGKVKKWFYGGSRPTQSHVRIFLRHRSPHAQVITRLLFHIPVHGSISSLAEIVFQKGSQECQECQESDIEEVWSFSADIPAATEIDQRSLSINKIFGRNCLVTKVRTWYMLRKSEYSLVLELNERNSSSWRNTNHLSADASVIFTRGALTSTVMFYIQRSSCISHCTPKVIPLGSNVLTMSLKRRQNCNNFLI